MNRPIDQSSDIALYYPVSETTTEKNNTGTWRFLAPRYAEKTAPCAVACPAGQDIARIQLLVSRNQFAEAWKTITLENPLPSVCGRVCFHPCTAACNRRSFDEAVTIPCVERFVGDMALTQGVVLAHEKRPATGKRIGIVGAGPMGLSAAYFLALLGFECEILEAKSEPGGLLRWGIPEYRLDPAILKQEIDRITGLGVTIRLNTRVTKDFLKNPPYDGVVLGCGYGRPVSLAIPGEDHCIDGLGFLESIRQGTFGKPSGYTAAVIGGGNTAIDVARSLVRLGVRATIVYRRRQQDMPAFSQEINQALEEGVRIKPLLSPVSIEATGQRLTLTLQKMKPDVPDGTNRATVVADADKMETLTVDQVYSAIGAEPEGTWLIPGKDQDVMNFSHCRMIRAAKPVIIGGDLATPVKSVTDAIGSGKQAALVLATYFEKGTDAIASVLDNCRVGPGPSLSMEIFLKGPRSARSSAVVDEKQLNVNYFEPVPANVPKSLPLSQRTTGFAEVERTFSESVAVAESSRCFQCGICNDCDNCRLFCPETAVRVEDGHHRFIHMDYCKGCGICVKECPRNAMTMDVEEGLS